jgi:two-component system, LytTR family, response regulator
MMMAFPSQDAQPSLLRAIIVDNEPSAREELRRLLELEPGVCVVSECQDAEAAIAAVHAFRPELLLLDLQMPRGDGVLNALTRADSPVVILTKSQNGSRVNVQERGGADYLLKPVDQERLRTALGRARRELQVARSGDLAARLEHLLQAAARRSAVEDRILIKHGGRIIFLNPRDIDWLEASGNYVRFHAGKESYLVRMPLARAFEKLDRSRFIQVHRSIIVNVDRIKELIRCNVNEFIVVLQDAKQLPCGRRYSSLLRSLLKAKL